MKTSKEPNSKSSNVSAEDKILKVTRKFQFDIWKILIEDNINSGQLKVQLNLCSKDNTYNYLKKYEYQTNLSSLLGTKEGLNFVKWLKNNKLTYSISEYEDGIGYESWQNINIKMM